MRHKPRFRNASLLGFAGEPVPSLLSRTDSRECWPIAIHLRRSFLRYRPSASRSGRGVADQSLARLRTASHPHEPRQQKLARLVFPPPTQRLAASVQPPRVNWGGFPLAALLRSSSLSLAPAHSARCLEGGEKVCAFLPLKPPHRPANAGTKPMPTHPPAPTEIPPGFTRHTPAIPPLPLQQRDRACARLRRVLQTPPQNPEMHSLEE